MEDDLRVGLGRKNFFKDLFIYLSERERESTSRGVAGRGRRKAPHRARSLMQDLIPGPWDHDLNRRQRL